MDYVCAKMIGEVVMRRVWVRVFSFLLSIINLRALVLVVSTLLLYSTCCTTIDNIAFWCLCLACCGTLPGETR